MSPAEAAAVLADAVASGEIERALVDLREIAQALDTDKPHGLGRYPDARDAVLRVERLLGRLVGRPA